MKNLISGMVLAVILCGLYATAQQVTTKLPSATVKLNGSGGGGGDITAVDIATTSPLTGGANCTTGACSFTLGLTGGTLSGLTAGKLPVATSATAVADSAITHNSTTGVTTFGGSGPKLELTEGSVYPASGGVLALDGDSFVSIRVGGTQRAYFDSQGGFVAPTNTSTQVLSITNSTQNAASTALVDATATGFTQIAVLSNTVEGGVLAYTLFATDATDYQTRSGSIPFALRNVGGTRTCTFGTASDAYDGTGTLTVSWDCVSSTDPYGQAAVTLRATADTSLASTTIFTIQHRPNITSGLATVTPQ